MKIEEIRELKEMGFTNQEILQFATSGEVTRTVSEEKKPDSKQEEKKPEEKKPDSKQEEKKPEEKKPDSKPEENLEITELKNTVSGLQKDMKDFITTMQKNNLQSASVNLLPDADLEKQSIDALSEIIRPKYLENKEDAKK